MYQEIKIADIIVEKQPRKFFDKKKMEELTNSVRAKGIIQPLLVRKDGPKKFELVAGERRLRAAKIAQLKDVPCIVWDLNDTQVMEIRFIENLQREGLHPLEEAEGYEVLLKKHGYKTTDDIAAKIGKSRSYIYGRLKLCDLISENRKLFYEGKFSPSVALLVARVPGDLQKEAGKVVAAGGSGWNKTGEPMSYRAAQKYVSENFMLQLRGAPFDTKDKTLCKNIGPCTICPKRTGNQKELFPDISSADVCTDPGCFNMKKNAFTQRMVAKAKASGKKVVSLEEAKKLFPYEHASTPEHKYVSLDQTCYELPKSPKYRELVKRVKDAPIVYAVQPFNNKLIELLEKTEIPKIFKKIGIKMGSDGSGPSRDPNALAKAKTQNRIREAKRGFWINKVSTARDRRCMNVVILDILLADLGTGTADALLPFKTRESYYRSWDIPKLYELGDAEVQKLIVKVISKKSDVLDDDDLKFLSTKLGFNIAKEYIITETYLQAMTKFQLVVLSNAIGLTKYLEQKKICVKLADKKKKELIEFFLKKGFKLEGKVPKEIAK